MIKEIKKETPRKNSCKFVLIIEFREFVGRNPPADTRVIVKFKALKSLTSEKTKNEKTNSVIKKYKKNILIETFLMLVSGFKLLSPL